MSAHMGREEFDLDHLLLRKGDIDPHIPLRMAYMS